MKRILLLLAALTLLAACSKGRDAGSSQLAQLRDANHSVKDYFNDADLRAATRAACSADSEAQYDAYAKLPACRNAAKADHLVQTGRRPE